MSAEARTREKVAKAMREAMELREACAHVADSAKRAQLLDVAGRLVDVLDDAMRMLDAGRA